MIDTKVVIDVHATYWQMPPSSRVVEGADAIKSWPRKLGKIAQRPEALDNEIAPMATFGNFLGRNATTERGADYCEERWEWRLRPNEGDR